MKRILFLAISFGLLLSTATAQAPPVCVPVITSPNIDGLVATDPFHLRNGTSDPGWAVAPYQPFALIPMGMSTKAAFFIGTKLSGANPDHLYVGVHVEGTDQFSSGDTVTLYFDSDKDGTFDFALKYEIGPAAPASDGNQSGQSPNNISFYTFTGGSFVQQATPAESSLKSRTSYNFTGGIGNGIWELEADINLTALGLPVSAANGIAFGARLYVQPVNIGATPLVWPSGFSTDVNPNHTDPNQGGVTAANLDKRSVATTCVGDVQVISMKSRARNGDDLFYLPKDGDFLSNGSLPAQFQTQLFASGIYVNSKDTGNTSPLGGTNAGNLHFQLLPWGMGPVDTVEVGKFPLTFTQFGTSIQATDPGSGDGSITWPKTQSDWNAHKSHFLDRSASGSDHVCFRVTVEGFAQNSDTSNDAPQINLQYTTMSSHRDKFLIHAPGTSSPGAAKEDYVLHVHWDNLNKSEVRNGDEPEKKKCWFLRFLDELFHKKPKTYWQAKFVNGDALGIKPLGHGYYGLKLAPGEEVLAEVEISGETMPVHSVGIHVPPTAGGQVLTPSSGTAALTVSVPAGGMVTVVARGSIGVVSNPDITRGVLQHNANGFSASPFDSSKMLLNSKVTASWTVTGALIGSFNSDFSDSFFIGTEGTFFVPPDASTLYLAVNDVAGQYGDNIGAGFDANVVATPPTILPAKLSWPANPKLGVPAIPQPAANLPLLNIDLAKVDNEQKAATPVGYVGYAVYDAHGGAANNPR